MLRLLDMSLKIRIIAMFIVLELRHTYIVNHHGNFTCSNYYLTAALLQVYLLHKELN
jgi:hypothetical protein